MANILGMVESQLYTSWDDIICPICLDSPHNCVLLRCTSYDSGCRIFVCDTDHLHSNCLSRFKQANGLFQGSKSATSENLAFLDFGQNVKPACPLCRGEVIGWTVVDKARTHLNEKRRNCEVERCAFVGTYLELQKHAKLEHPHSLPSKIDSARQLDWDNFQQSSEIIDVLSTIQSEVPRGVVLGDYVIEYGNDNSRDDFDDIPADEGNRCASCILYQVFGGFRTHRNRRSRVRDLRRRNHHLSFDASIAEEASVSSIENADYRATFDAEDVFVDVRGLSNGRATQSSSRRRSSRVLEN